MAEDNAIEDTIYHMTRALDSERIDLDRYMKVRLWLPSIPSALRLLRIHTDHEFLVYTDARKGAVHETSIDREDIARYGTDTRMVEQ